MARELFAGIDSMDGKKSVFLVDGENMYVSFLGREGIEHDDWYSKDCCLADYVSEPLNRDRFKGAKKIW